MYVAVCVAVDVAVCVVESGAYGASTFGVLQSVL